MIFSNTSHSIMTISYAITESDLLFIFSCLTKSLYHLCVSNKTRFSIDAINAYLYCLHILPYSLRAMVK